MDKGPLYKKPDRVVVWCVQAHGSGLEGGPSAPARPDLAMGGPWSSLPGPLGGLCPWCVGRLASRVLRRPLSRRELSVPCVTLLGLSL